MTIKSQDYMAIEKQLYISELVSELKPDISWQTNEMKIFSLILNRLKPNIHLLKKDSNIEELKMQLNNIDNTFTFTVKELSKQLDISPKNFSKVATRLKKTLKQKSIDTQHPDIPDDDDSFDSYIMINRVTYNAKDGLFSVRVDKLAIERLIYFSKYGRSDIKYIDKFHNKYALYLYMIIKITLDSSRRQKKSFKLSIDEFKTLLNLENKYRNYSEFNKYVLEVINSEINSINSDLELKIKSEKVGKAYKTILLNFDYKPEYLEQKAKSKSKKISQLNEIENTYIDNNDSPFEHTLTGWGIRAKKVVDMEETYSLDVIQSAIELTLEKEKAGEIKTTKAAIFLGILENKQQASDEVFEREQQQLAKQNEKDHLKALGAEYDAIQKVINYNDDEISSYLSAKAMGATYEISPALNEQLLNMSCVDAEKFKGFRPKLPVLHNGYFDLSQDKKIFPNLYDFLILIDNF